MTTIQDLRSLYDQGDFSKCPDSLSTFLWVNRDSIEALLLKAKCEFRIANQNPGQAPNDNSLFINAYNSFEEAYVICSVYQHLYYTSNLPEAKIYCDILARSENEDTRLEAIDYRRQVNFSLGNIDLVLNDIDLMINHYKELSPNNRYILDKELSLLYLEKTKIYLWHQVDALMVFQTFREGKEYPYDNYETHHAVALLALDYQELDLAGEAVFMAFQSNVDEPGQEWNDLYHRINELNKKGVLSKPMVHGLIIAASGLYFQDV